MIAGAGLGLLIGVLLGLLGGGGSILAVPALVYGAGVPLAAAGADVAARRRRLLGHRAAAPAAQRAGGLAHRRGVRGGRGRGGVRRGGGEPAARPPAGADRVRRPDGRRRGADAAGAGARRRGLRATRRRGQLAGLPAQIGSGLAVGFLTGLFGVGGGFLIIPALALLLGLSMTVAVGTSLLIVVVNSAAGFAAHAGDTPLDYRLAAVFTLAAVAGSVLAAPLATRLPADRLRRWFAYLVLAIAAFVVAQALFNPAAAAG